MKGADFQSTINRETAMKNLTTLVASAAFAACILTAAPAHAGTDPQSETVRFADLNTTDARGTAVLFQRVVLAAHSVCRDLEAGGSLPAIMRFSKCWHSAVRNAVTTVNLPTLTQYAVANGIVPADAVMRIADRN
jgi:UrcA family protein